jgi:hypothetical protein
MNTRGMPRRKASPALIAALVGAHLAITALTWWSLRRRTPDQVRGSKHLWRIASAANMTNSALYFMFGRKRSNQHDG